MALIMVLIFLRTAYCSASDPGSVGYVRAIRIIPSLIDADMLKLMTCVDYQNKCQKYELNEEYV